MSGLAETQIPGATERAPSRPRLDPRPGTRRLMFAGAIVLVAAAVGVWRYTSGRESTDDAQIDGHIVAISSKVGGNIVEVNVNDNQYVRAGTVLVRIDPTDYRVAAEKAKADLAKAQAAAQGARAGVPIASTTTGSQLATSEARVETAQAGVVATEKQVDAARARQNGAQARLEELRANQTKARRDLERMKQLIAKDEISQQQYDAAAATAEASGAAVTSAEAGVAEAGRELEVAQSRVAQARATLAQARADLRAAQTGPEQVMVTRAFATQAEANAQQAKATLEEAQLRLDYTTVRAPVTGWVSRKTVHLGEVIQPGLPLMAIVPEEEVWVTANFKETQLKKMRAGQPATISVDAYGGRKYRGHVESISAATGEKFSLLPPENATGNYVKVVQRVPVKIAFEKGQDPEHLLRPGMSVVPTVVTK